MEKEQKRLSRYQAESAGASSEEYSKDGSTPSKDQNGNQLNRKKPSSSAAATTAAFKYVVDRTKPKTDLEYDPCSNFSAALRPGNLTDKIKSSIKVDVESEQRVKETGSNVAADPVRLSPHTSEDSDDDRMLVIDIPPIENQKYRSDQTQKPSIAATVKITTQSKENDVLVGDAPPLQMTNGTDCLAQSGIAGIQDQDKVEGLRCQPTVQRDQKVKLPGGQHAQANHDCNSSETIVELDSLHVAGNRGICKNLTQVMTLIKSDETRMEASQVCRLKSHSAIVCPPGCEKEAQLGEKVPEDIYSCLDHLRRESENISHPEGEEDSRGVPSSSRPQVKVCTQAGHDFNETRPESSDKESKQQTDTLPFEPRQEAGVVQRGCPTTSSLPVQPKDPESDRAKLTSVQQQDQTEIVLNLPGCSSGSDFMAVPAETTVSDSSESAPMLSSRDQPSSVPPIKADDQVIQINSSSEELNYSDLDVSDSDPMEECYRIFMEAKNAENSSHSSEMQVS